MVNGNSTVERASDQFQPSTAPQVQHGLIKNTAYNINVFAEIGKNFPRIFRRVLKGHDLKFDVRVQSLNSGPEIHQELCRSHGRGTDADDILILLHGVLRPRHRIAAVLNDVFKYIIQYCRDSVTRAKNAMQEDENIIRIGSSPMTPAQLLMDLWSRVQTLHPDIKFQIVPFENTPENAREILANLGKNIDIVGGIFDETMLHLRGCAGLELVRGPFHCAVSIHHRLAAKDKLQITDLYGENLMLMHRGWSHYVDQLRDDLWQHHPQIHIVDFDFYNMDVFNRCENTNDVLLAIPGWATVHPLLKIIPVEWNYSIPYGILHSPEPTPTVQRFLDAAKIISKELYS